MLPLQARRGGGDKMTRNLPDDSATISISQSQALDSREVDSDALLIDVNVVSSDFDIVIV